MCKNILIAGLTLGSILVSTANSTRAELAPNLNSLTVNRIESNTYNHDRRIATSDRDRSMEYTQMGWAEQNKGNDKQALAYYTQAVELDSTNGYAFMAAGNLLGETEEGIICMKAAVLLFKEQSNEEGYQASLGWLEEHNIDTSEVK